MNIPNIITLWRICMVPVIIWMILDKRMEAAFWVSLAAALSDAADGVIAKQFNMRTTLGAYLDPIADKALLVSIFVVLGYEGFLPTWLVILVVFRDILIIGGALLFYTLTQSLEMTPLIISKVNTVNQLLLGLVVLGTEAFGIRITIIYETLIYLTGFTTLISGAYYVMGWTHRASNLEGNKF